MNFTENELSVISNALRVAAEHFQKDISELSQNYGANPHRAIAMIADQFAYQKHEAEKLYEKISSKTGIQT